jgi:DnaJ-domain-containing protein 1
VSPPTFLPAGGPVKGAPPDGRPPSYAGGTTHYDTLGLTPAATAGEVREAYLALARRHHPDRHDDRDPAGRTAAGSRMQEVNAAWAVLGDPAAREAYDAALGLAAPAEPEGEPAARSRVQPDEEEAWSRPEPAGPRRYVALAVVVLLLLAFFVFTAYAGAPRS